MTDVIAPPLPARKKSPPGWSPAGPRIIDIVVASGVFIMVALLWDISWHQTIGRDSILVPPHVMSYIAAAAAGLTSGYAVLRTTFFSNPAVKSTTVRFWGFNGPLGLWITIWGVLTLIASVPFDDWWHNAYGLDAKVVTPPHMVLMAGLLGIVSGSVVATSSVQNRSPSGGALSTRDAWFFAIAGGSLVFGISVFTLENSFPTRQHAALFYQIWCAFYPLVLVAYSRAGRLKWSATASAAVYMLVWLIMGLVLRHVSATPKLGPVYNPRTYMWPPYFPPLLIFPALAIDMVRRRLPDLDSWRAAVALGLTFVVVFVGVEWPFASFMLSEAANNGFFNGNEKSYQALLKGPRRFVGDIQLSSVATGLLVATVLSMISSRAGLGLGAWLARIKR